MKNLLFICLFLPVLVWAQDSTDTFPRVARPVNAITYLEKSVWRVEFFGPGVINESRIGQHTTLVSQLRMVSAFQFYDNRAYNYTNPPTNTSYSAYTFNPQLSAGVRQFYNFQRRLERGKSIRYNSGNYVTVKLAYVLPPVIRHNTDQQTVRTIEGGTAQVMWGFQRTYRKNFYLNLEVGLGTGNYSPSPVALATYFTLGYTFAGKNRVPKP